MASPETCPTSAAPPAPHLFTYYIPSFPWSLKALESLGFLLEVILADPLTPPQMFHEYGCRQDSVALFCCSPGPKGLRGEEGGQN